MDPRKELSFTKAYKIPSAGCWIVIPRRKWFVEAVIQAIQSVSISEVVWYKIANPANISRQTHFQLSNLSSPSAISHSTNKPSMGLESISVKRFRYTPALPPFSPEKLPT
jgi:hypothetical protein